MDFLGDSFVPVCVGVYECDTDAIRIGEEGGELYREDGDDFGWSASRLTRYTDLHHSCNTVHFGLAGHGIARLLWVLRL